MRCDMGWLYNVLIGCDVYVLKVTTTGSNPIIDSDVIWFDADEKIWRSAPLNHFRPPKEKH